MYVTEDDKSGYQWPCYECTQQFRTSADLQKHLSVHDDDVGLPDTSAAEARNDPECVLPGNSRRGYRRKWQAQVPSADAASAAGNDDDATVCTFFHY